MEAKERKHTNKIYPTQEGSIYIVDACSMPPIFL